MSAKPSILIMISNDKERKILEMAFEQRGFDVIIESANHNTYIKALQFLPDVIFIQFDNKNGIEQERFSKAIISNKKSEKIFVVGYVSQHSYFNPDMLKGIGIPTSYIKPLKFSDLLTRISKVLTSKGKSFEIHETKVNDLSADLAIIFDSSANPLDKIDIMVKYVSKLYAFPFAVTKIIKLSQDENSSANDLSRIVESDSVITANLLKLSNTVVYATRGGKVKNVKDAIVRIGFNETKKLASAMAVMDLFKGDDNTMGYSGAEFWVFTIAVSSICEIISKTIGVDEMEMYITALLHGFGAISLNQYFPKVFSMLLNENLEQSYYYPKTEKKIVNFNNFEYAAALFEKWDLPRTFSKALREIKPFDEFPEVINSAHEDIAYIISVARIITKFLSIGQDCDSYVKLLDKKVIDKLKLNMGITDNFVSKVHKKIVDYIDIFGLDKDLLQKEPEKPTKNRVGIYNLDKLVFLGIDKYLKINGYNVDTILDISKKSDFIDEVSIIVAETVDNKSVEAVKTELIKRYSSGHTKRIIIITSKENDVYQTQKQSGIITYNTSFDLRVFEDTINKMANNAYDLIVVPPESPVFDQEAILTKIRTKLGLQAKEATATV